MIIEPVDDESVPAAAALLSSKLPEEPFVIHYHSKNIYDNIEKSPIFDLSFLRKGDVDGNSVTIDAGVTFGKSATLLKKSKSSKLKELYTALRAISYLSIIEAALDG